MTIFGGKLQAIMDALGITQAEVARRVGVTRQCVYGWLNEREPSLTTVRRVAAEFGTTAAWLLDDTKADETADPIDEPTPSPRNTLAAAG